MSVGFLNPNAHGEDLYGLLPFALSTLWPIGPIKIAENSLMRVFRFVRPVLFAIHIARINSALKIPDSRPVTNSEPKKFMNSEDIYQMMIGKVVMVAVALE